MKYTIVVIVLLVVGGLFYWGMNRQTAPVEDTANQPQDTQAAENIFEEPATVVGDLEGEATSGITRAELAIHNTQEDCWVSYKGIVYDITQWLPRHPGTANAILPYCGTAEEFAQAFNRQHGTRQEARLEKEGTEQGPLTE